MANVVSGTHMSDGRPLSIAVLGVTGRMGKALLAAIDEADDARLSGACASPGSGSIGRDAGTASGGHERGVLVSADVAAAVRQCNVAIDFTVAAATVANAQACAQAGRALVIGTTGHDASALREIEAAAARIPIVMAPNMSLGVNLLLRLVREAAAKLDASYDIEVFEAHHRNKKDAPSGTALALGRAAATGRKVDLADVAVYERHGASQEVRRPGAIGFSVFRGGDVVGDHTVTFAGIGERVELSHRATDRMAFARGAVAAARWLCDRKPGLYSMQDVLDAN